MGMKTQFFVDAAGNYLGGFAGVEPPIGAIEVERAPDHALQKWDGAKWLPLVVAPTSLTLAEMATILMSKGIITPADITQVRK